MRGEYSSVGRAPVCGTGCQGFDPLYSPLRELTMVFTFHKSVYKWAIKLGFLTLFFAFTIAEVSAIMFFPFLISFLIFILLFYLFRVESIIGDGDFLSPCEGQFVDRIICEDPVLDSQMYRFCFVSGIFDSYGKYSPVNGKIISIFKDEKDSSYKKFIGVNIESPEYGNVLLLVKSKSFLDQKIEIFFSEGNEVSAGDMLFWVEFGSVSFLFTNENYHFKIKKNQSIRACSNIQ